MKRLLQQSLVPLLFITFFYVNSTSALTIHFTQNDRIPSNQCTDKSCQLPIVSEDPCGEGGITVLDPSGSPSCEPIERIAPAAVKKLREAANLLEYKLYKSTGTNTTVDDFTGPTDTGYQLCCDKNDVCSPAPPLPGVCPYITTDCYDDGSCIDQE